MHMRSSIFTLQYDHYNVVNDGRGHWKGVHNSIMEYGDLNTTGIHCSETATRIPPLLRLLSAGDVLPDPGWFGSSADAAEAATAWSSSRLNCFSSLESLGIHVCV